MFVTAVMSTPALCASCALARFSSSGSLPTSDRAEFLSRYSIENNPGQSVAFAPDNAMQLGIYLPSLPIFRRLGNSPLEKIEIEILPSVRKTARHNLRFRIPHRAPKHSIAPILNRNNVAIGRITEDLQHLAGKNPVVPVQNPRPRSNDNSSH